MTNKPLLLLAALACGFAVLPGCDRSASADNPAASTSASASPAPADGLDTLFSIAPFTLTDQDNQPFGTEQLKGKTWIASLFFTTCPGPCPMMQGRLNAIEDAVQNPNVLIVSVSVDPEHDTPEKMKAYAKRMGVDEHRRFFLTGPLAEVQHVANDDLKLAFQPATATSPIVHATKFLLVDKSGNVRGIYSTEDDASMKQLGQDARKLAAEK